MVVHNSAKTTTGSVSFMDLYSMVTQIIGQNNRKGALMLSMDIEHPDIEDFINVKTDLDRVTKANISVMSNDRFMEAVINDDDWVMSFTTEHGDNHTKTVKARYLFNLIATNNHRMGEPGFLYMDRIHNWNLTCGYDDYKIVGTNPCGEQPLSDYSSCLLGSINLSEFVVNPFTEKAYFDFEDFKDAIRIVVRAMDDVLEENIERLPLQKQKEKAEQWRQVGIGQMGLADMFIKLGLKYGEKKSLEISETIAKILINEAMRNTALLAKERGTFPKFDYNSLIKSDFYNKNMNEDVKKIVEMYGMRNCALLSIAPTGTIGTFLETSTGIEPNFKFKYTRKTESLGNQEEYHDVYAKIAREYREKNNNKELPNYFVESDEIEPLNRIKMQSIWQTYIDTAISSTVNLPENATVEDIEDIYINAWKYGLKGITIFRNNCERMGILTTDKKEDTEVEEVKELRRGEIVPTNDNVIGLKRKITGGCGSLHVQAFFDEKTGKMTEVFINKGGSGGCNSNLNALSRMISIALRSGVRIEDIADQLASTINCPSFASARAKGLPLSQGSSCPSAVGRVLVEMNKDFQEMFKPKKTNKEDALDDKKEDKELCPECKEALTRTGGCVQCPNCSWSKCD